MITVSDPIPVLVEITLCYPYAKTNQKCSVMHNIHFCVVSIAF